ncbi:hypothetical protein D9615_006500 [Tricholomella constricta]|uniref:Uncharacterized protein n=1 Tax=Tricholomella constricta TaxID=117010 RepID=A0A8H5M3L1_9AGAR|nr:hypothetical protein D9615_006500 [Tricholomella constricta]
MGAHHNQQNHRRAAAAKQRRLAAQDDDEEASVKSLIARFSPTVIYTETMTDLTTEPVISSTDTPTTAPAPPPTTSAPAAPTTAANTPPPNTETTPTQTPDQPTTTESPPDNDVQTTTSPDVVTTPPVVTRPTSTLSQPRSILTTQSTLSIASSAASSTPSEPAGSGTNVGGVIGGIAAALLGLVAVVFVVRLIMNRKRKREEDNSTGFNASDFRRSAVLMNDPPTHDETVERGFNPRPPTMIERRLASPAPTFGTQYGAPAPFGGNEYGGNEYGNMDQYGQYQTFAPGQLMNNMSPISATSAHPTYPNAAYGQSPFSPIGSPVSEMAPGYEGGQPGVLTRQPSANGANGYPQDDAAQYATYPNQANLPVQNEYVDLDRSSVTPYQAAQYAEISKQLNTEVPAGLDTPAVNNMIHTSNEAPPVPTNDINSPFADPIPAALLPAAAAQVPRHSTDSVSHELNDFPIPPSPAHNSSPRIDSTPPMLPEIHVESRVASYDFPNAVRSHQFPATPSPLASSFGIATPSAAATSFPAAEPAPAAAPAAVPAAAPAAAPARAPAATDEKKRPDTIYDDDDAYGGF